MLGPLIALVATHDAEASRAFYTDVLGLRFLADEPYALVFDCHGLMLRIQKVEKVTEVGYTSLGWSVTDIEASARDLKAKGVEFSRYEFLTQDELGIWTSPDGNKVAWFRDPCGNNLSLTQFGFPSTGDRKPDSLSSR